MDTAPTASAILFDLDGVLVDSMPIVRAYWADWARQHQRDPGEVLAFIHLTAEELVRRFAPDLDAAEEARKTADGQAGMEKEIVLFAGARELIGQLPLGRWGVVTSARRSLAVRHLRLGHLPIPDVLVTAEDTPSGKPDPAGYLLAASRLGFPASHCVAIEDSPAGVRAARHAGMFVFAVTNTHAPDELTEANAVLDSLASLRVRMAREASDGLVVSFPRGPTLG
jgi:sugar-phosphatase